MLVPDYVEDPSTAHWQSTTEHTKRSKQIKKK